MQSTARQLINDNTYSNYSQNAQKSLNSRPSIVHHRKHYKLTAKAKRVYGNILGVIIVTGVFYCLMELALRCFE